MTLCHDCRLPFAPSLPRQLYCQGCRTVSLHNFEEHNCYSKPRNRALSQEDVLAIRKSAGKLQALAKVYGVSDKTIWNARTGRTYADVK